MGKEKNIEEVKKELLCYYSHLAEKLNFNQLLCFTAVVASFVLFWRLINNLWIEYIVNPILSFVPDGNIWVFLILLFLCGLFAFLVIKKFKDEIVLFPLRVCYEGLFLVVFIFGFCSKRYEFTGLGSASYIYIPFAFLLCSELFLSISKIICRKKKTVREGEQHSLYYDSPTEQDDYGRSSYAKKMIQVIKSTFEANKKQKANAFTIGLNEAYGEGKTSFILLLNKELNEKENQHVIHFDFKPWSCSSANDVISEFFAIMQLELSVYEPSINRTIDRYLSSLSIEKSNWFISLIRLCCWQADSALSQYKDLSDKIKKIGKPVVIIVDDLDRLEYDELMGVFKLIRNTADFQNFFFILAYDKEHVLDTLRENKLNEPERYLEKIINLEIVMPAYEKSILIKVLEKELRAILAEIVKPDRINNLIRDILERKLFNSKCLLIEVLDSFRNVYRFLNSFKFTVRQFEGEVLDDIYLPDLFWLELIKFLNPEVYKTIRSNPRVLFNFPPQYKYTLKKDFQLPSKDKELEALVRSYIAQKNKRKAEPAGSNNYVLKSDTKKERETDAKTIVQDILSAEGLANEIVEKILFLLFTNSVNSDQQSVCYVSSFFKYFAYKLKSNEISYLELLSLLSLDDLLFQEEARKLIHEEKEKSFFFNLKNCSEKKEHDEVSILKKLFTFIEEMQKYIVIPESERIYFLTETKADKIKYIFRNNRDIAEIIYYLFSKSDAEVDSDKENLANLKAYMRINNPDFIVQKSLLLGSLKNEPNKKLIVSDADIQKMYKMIGDISDII